jgi:hypothetical protein
VRHLRPGSPPISVAHDFPIFIQFAVVASAVGPGEEHGWGRRKFTLMLPAQS